MQPLKAASGSRHVAASDLLRPGPSPSRRPARHRRTMGPSSPPAPAPASAAAPAASTAGAPAAADARTAAASPPPTPADARAAALLAAGRHARAQGADKENAPPPVWRGCEKGGGAGGWGTVDGEESGDGAGDDGKVDPLFTPVKRGGGDRRPVSSPLPRSPLVDITRVRVQGGSLVFALGGRGGGGRRGVALPPHAVLTTGGLNGLMLNAFAGQIVADPKAQRQAERERESARIARRAKVLSERQAGRPSLRASMR